MDNQNYMKLIKNAIWNLLLYKTCLDTIICDHRAAKAKSRVHFLHLKSQCSEKQKATYTKYFLIQK